MDFKAVVHTANNDLVREWKFARMVQSGPLPFKLQEYIMCVLTMVYMLYSCNHFVKVHLLYSIAYGTDLTVEAAVVTDMPILGGEGGWVLREK